MNTARTPFLLVSWWSSSTSLLSFRMQKAPPSLRNTSPGRQNDFQATAGAHAARDPPLDRVSTSPSLPNRCQMKPLCALLWDSSHGFIPSFFGQLGVKTSKNTDHVVRQDPDLAPIIVVILSFPVLPSRHRHPEGYSSSCLSTCGDYSSRARGPSSVRRQNRVSVQAQDRERGYFSSSQK